jgi:hypothetical protein
MKVDCPDGTQLSIPYLIDSDTDLIYAAREIEQPGVQLLRLLLYGCMVVWLYGCMVVWLYGCMVVWLLFVLTRF